MRCSFLCSAAPSLPACRWSRRALFARVGLLTCAMGVYRVLAQAPAGLRKQAVNVITSHCGPGALGVAFLARE